MKKIQLDPALNLMQRKKQRLKTWRSKPDAPPALFSLLKTPFIAPTLVIPERVWD